MATWPIVALTPHALDPSFFIMLHYPQGFRIPTPLDLLTLLSPSWNKLETFYSQQQTVVHIRGFCSTSSARFSPSSRLPHGELCLPKVEGVGRINPLSKCFWTTYSLKWQGRIYGNFFFFAVPCRPPSLMIFYFLFLGVFQSVIKINRRVWLNKSPSSRQSSRGW